MGIQRRTRLGLAGLVAVAVTAGGAIVNAAASSVNEAGGDLGLVDSIEWFEYGTGSKLAVTGAAGDEFDDTILTAGGDVQLDRWIPGSDDPDPAVPWAEPDHRGRVCTTVAGFGVQYVDVRFDSLAPAGWEASGWVQPDYSDVRPAVWDGSATSTPDFWLATPFDTDDGHLFVEVDFGGGGTKPARRTVCIYIGGDPAAGPYSSASDPALGQDWSDFRQVYDRNTDDNGWRYVVFTNPTDSAVTVRRSPNNWNQAFTVPANGRVGRWMQPSWDEVYANGPVIAHAQKADGGRDDSLMPTWFRGTLFVSKTSRGVQRWCFAGPQNTDVTVNPSSGPAVVVTIGNGVTCESVDTTSHTVISAPVPVGVFHESEDEQDPHSLYPATSEPLYGVPSRYMRLGASGAGSFELVNSADGSVQTVAAGVSGGEPVGANGPGSPQQGAGPAYRITPVGMLGSAIQQADSNGNQSTTMLPLSAMSARYVLPETADYVAITCPNPDEVILVNGSPTPCTGVNVGYLRLGATAAGSVLQSESGSAFHAVAQFGAEETNMFVPRFDWAEVTGDADVIESAIVHSGVWTSSPFAADGDVWGLLTAEQDVPVGTSVSWEAACAATAAGPFVFVPVVLGDAMPHGCDGSDWVQLRATLTSSDGLSTPSITAGCVEYDLALAGPVDVSASVVAGANWLWRNHAPVPFAALMAQMVPMSASSSGVYELVAVDGSMVDHAQVLAIAPAFTEFADPVPVSVSSIRADVKVELVGADQFVWSSSLAASAGVGRSITLSS